MAYDAVKMKDWQISEAAEENMPTQMNGGGGSIYKRMRLFPTGDYVGLIS